jgi:hypothetical protein
MTCHSSKTEYFCLLVLQLWAEIERFHGNGLVEVALSLGHLILFPLHQGMYSPGRRNGCCLHSTIAHYSAGTCWDDTNCCQ